MKSKVLINSLGAIAGIFFILLVRPHNLGFSFDSMFYLLLAENLREGYGLVLDNGFLETHWPPLYPVVLASLSVLAGIPVLEIGVYFNAICLYGFLITFYHILEELKINNKLSIFLTFLLLFSYPTLNFRYYLSEAFFLVLLLLSFLFLLKWLKRGNIKYLYPLGIFCGTMYLTRYAALGFIGAYFLFLCCYEGDNKAKAKRIISLAFTIGLVLLPWFFFKINHQGETGIRGYNFEIISLGKIKEIKTTIGYWFIGSPITRLILPIVILLNMYIFRNNFRILMDVPGVTYKKYKDIIHLLLILVFTYITFLIISIIFYTSVIPLDNRLLAPIFPFILVLIGYHLQTLLDSSSTRVAFNSLLFILFLNFTAISAPEWIYQYKYGSGQSTRSWKNSEIVAFLSEQEGTLKIYTNGPNVIKWFSPFTSELLPRKNDQEKLERIKEEIKEGQAQIIFFDIIDWPNYYISADEISQEFKNLNLTNKKDGFMIKR